MVYFLCKAYDSGRQNCYFALSLPVRGAWVEMACVSVSSGGGGSLPVRGAWVEMGISPSSIITVKSLPVRGAWVEMFRRILFPSPCRGRSPCGERGLKLRVGFQLRDAANVAPRAGSVG